MTLRFLYAFKESSILLLMVPRLIFSIQGSSMAFVHRCYLRDDNRTPLGALADYIAENWESVRDKPAREVLEDFYY